MLTTSLLKTALLVMLTVGVLFFCLACKNIEAFHNGVTPQNLSNFRMITLSMVLKLVKKI